MSKHTMATGHGSRHRRKKVLGLTVALVAVAGAAFAYWTTTGSGTGSASTANNVAAVTIVQTSTVSGLAPGSGTQPLSGTITNTNSGPVHITSITATVDAVNDAQGDPITGCTADDYSIVGTGTVDGGTGTAASDDSSTWSGITIAFNNTGSNQDACKNAQLVIGYTAS